MKRILSSIGAIFWLKDDLWWLILTFPIDNDFLKSAHSHSSCLNIKQFYPEEVHGGVFFHHPTGVFCDWFVVVFTVACSALHHLHLFIWLFRSSKLCLTSSHHDMLFYNTDNPSLWHHLCLSQLCFNVAINCVSLRLIQLYDALSTYLYYWGAKIDCYTRTNRSSHNLNSIFLLLLIIVIFMLMLTINGLIAIQSLS